MILFDKLPHKDIPTGTYALGRGLVAIVADLDEALPRGVSKERCKLTKLRPCLCWSCTGRPNPFIHKAPAAYP